MDRNRGPLLRVIVVFGLAVLMWAQAIALGEESHGAPTSDDIVRRLVEQNKLRADHLKRYADERHYRVGYYGFPRSLSAEMVVKVTYEAPSTKHFQIVTQTGSKVLVDRVLKKLLEGEEEATRDQGQTALTLANYRFELFGQEECAGRQCFILHVEPRVESKFLYRGTVLVDAQDFAVARSTPCQRRTPLSGSNGRRSITYTKSRGSFGFPTQIEARQPCAWAAPLN